MITSISVGGILDQPPSLRLWAHDIINSRWMAVRSGGQKQDHGNRSRIHGSLCPGDDLDHIVGPTSGGFLRAMVHWSPLVFLLRPAVGVVAGKVSSKDKVDSRVIGLQPWAEPCSRILTGDRHRSCSQLRSCRSGLIVESVSRCCVVLICYALCLANDKVLQSFLRYSGLDWNGGLNQSS